MNDAATIALAATAAIALVDWIAVARGVKAVEYVAKPATMVALIACAVSLDTSTPARRWAFVVALGLSLVGDVFLMLPGDRFIPGVAAFFAAHLAYIVGFRIGDTSPGALLIGAAVVGLFVATVGRRILTGVRSTSPELAVPVSAYVGVISVMVASAVATQEPLAIAGAAVFMGSDALIAWNRFVQPMSWAGVAIMVSYHAGQTALVLSLAS